MVHIISEVVVLVGLTFYFNQKNKKLMAHIEDLAQRVEEQEDLLQKHDRIIKQVVDHIGKQQQVIQQNVVSTRPNNKLKTASLKKVSKPVLVKETQPIRVHFAQKEDSDSDSDYDSESDLDAELAEELNDLIDTEA